MQLSLTDLWNNSTWRPDFKWFTMVLIIEHRTFEDKWPVGEDKYNNVDMCKIKETVIERVHRT